MQTEFLSLRSQPSPLVPDVFGWQVPDLGLPNDDGKLVSLGVTLKEGPVAVSLYRGKWVTLPQMGSWRSLQHVWPEIKLFDATTVAIFPQLEGYSRV